MALSKSYLQASISASGIAAVLAFGVLGTAGEARASAIRADHVCEPRVDGDLTGGEDSQSPPAGAATLEQASDWYQFGTPARVVNRTEVVEHSVTLVTLSNGVRLALKPTKFADEILVEAAVDGGLLSLSLDSQPAAELGEQMFVASGVGLKTRDQLIAAFGPVASSLEFNLYDGSFNLSGKGKADDLDALLQVLTAYLVDPGWRPEALSVAKTAEVEAWAELRQSPNIWVYAQGLGLFRGGDPRWAVPSDAEIEAVQIDDVRAAIGGRLASGPMDVSIVGDFDLETAITAAAATFGSIPARPLADVAPVEPPSLISHTSEPLQVIHGGRSDLEGRFIIWPTGDSLSQPGQESVLMVLVDILGTRLERLPGYQSVMLQRQINASPPAYVGYIAEGPGDSLETFNADITRVAAEIARDGVTDDELNTVRDGRLETLREYFEGKNALWALNLMGIEGDPARLRQAAAYGDDLRRVTPADIQSAAAQYLREDTSIAVSATAGSAAQ